MTSTIRCAAPVALTTRVSARVAMCDGRVGFYAPRSVSGRVRGTAASTAPQCLHRSRITVGCNAGLAGITAIGSPTALQNSHLALGHIRFGQRRQESDPVGWVWACVGGLRDGFGRDRGAGAESR